MTNEVPAIPEDVSTIPVKDRFNVLFSHSAELAKALPSYQFQFSAALVIVLGWLLTSKDARAFLQANPATTKIGSTILVMSLIAFHSMWLTRHVNRAARVHEALKAFAASTFPGSDALVESVAIDRFLPWSYIAVNLLICGAIVVVCWSLAQTP